MIKDLSEAIYYCTVTEAMHSKEESMYSKDEKKHMYYPPRDMDRERGRMYYDGMMWEGRSPMSRKTYMEHKHQHLPKEMQIQELEKYM
jgi:hypothetical protein